jgi:hypothetical protein
VSPLRFAAVILCGIAFAAAPLGADDNDIDSLFDAPEDGADDIDSLFDAPEDSSDDIDLLFDVPEKDAGEERGEILAKKIPKTGSGSAVTGALQSRGFTFDVNYNFLAGYSPGWAENPLYWENHKDDTVDAAGNKRTEDPFTQVIAAKMVSSFSFDFRVSPAFRVRQVFQLAYPDYKLETVQFFADYNLYDTVFFRVGRHTVNWGVSRNFPFANLPVLLPLEDVNGKPLTTVTDAYSYAVKIDIPIGIGGLQLLALTRAAFMEKPASPKLEEFGYGLKYNLAFDLLDMDIGAYYHRSMPGRSFLSLKSTLPSGTEIYSEGVVAFSSTEAMEVNRPQYWDKREYSFAIGFYDDFFDRKLSLNLEYFFNGERNSRWLQPETTFQEEDVYDLLYGHNGAVNIIFKPGGSWNPRFFVQCLYGLKDKTTQLVPGVRFAPDSNFNVYLGFPMALGSREGLYYRQNADEKNRPFSIVLAVSFGGNYRLSHYEYE